MADASGGLLARLLGRRRTSAGDGVLGLELRADGVALAHVVGPDDAPRLAACDFRPCGDAAELGAVLTAAVREHGLAGTRCRVVLPAHRYGLRLVDAPEVEPEELGAAAQWLVKDLLDFPLEEAVIDHFQLPELHGRQNRLYVVTARNEVIREIASLTEEAGLALEVVDVSELALRNLTARLPEDAQGLALLRLGRRGGVITMTRDGHLYLARSVETGFETLREGAELEDLEREVYDPTALDAGPELGEGNEAFEAFDSLVLEIQRSLDFYESQLGQAPIGHLVVAPLEEEVPGLREYLEKHLSTSVGALEIEALLAAEVAPTPQGELLQARCLLALGVALRREGEST
jgi:MSHA biogenesis protein MshI